MSIDLSSINNAAGFKVDGVGSNGNGDDSGVSIASTGDVNGDGFADIMIGADYASPLGRTKAGESYVIFGKKGKFEVNPETWSES